jgi:hypothetical protein
MKCGQRFKPRLMQRLHARDRNRPFLVQIEREREDVTVAGICRHRRAKKTTGQDACDTHDITGHPCPAHLFKCFSAPKVSTDFHAGPRSSLMTIARRRA